VKRIRIGNSYYRMRKGKLVKIPNKWVDQVTHPQTIRKRLSKMTHKLRRRVKLGRKGFVHNYYELKEGMLDECR